MQRVTLHIDRRRRNLVDWYVLVIDGIVCAAGERGSMIALCASELDVENVTQSTCATCGR
jgi:hypothetical protein